MDPIRTAVKYALIPLRIVVQLGELYVAQPEAQDEPVPRVSEPPEPSKQPRPRRAASKPSPQAIRDDSVPKGAINVNAVDGVVSLRGQAKTPKMSNRRPNADRKVTTAAKNGS